MSLERLLVQRCTVRRPAVTGEDAHGNPVYGETLVAQDVPCRLVVKTAQVVRGDLASGMPTESHRVILGRTADVRANDVVEVDVNGQPMRYRVTGVLSRWNGQGLHHVVALVEVP